MPQIRTTSGKAFDAMNGEVLLDAALRAHVTLAYSCKTGRCSTCKGKLKSGSTIAVHDESGLTAAERDAGWILTCSRSATSDVELEADDLSEAHLAAAKTVPCRIDALEWLAADVLKVVLRLPPATAFDFRPGQYVDVIGPGGVRRSYSIANAPTEARRIELHIRQVADGVLSDYWFNLAKVNDLLRVNGPLGTFYLRDVDGLELVFLATGTGIAPVKAMLEGLAASSPSGKPSSVSVYWGGRRPEDLYWNSSALSIDCDFFPVLSRAGSDWGGATGYVQDALLSRPMAWAKAAVYACGSEAMIRGARRKLLDAGLPEQRFNADAFVCSAS